MDIAHWSYSIEYSGFKVFSLEFSIQYSVIPLSMCITPMGLFLRVIVNATPLNLKRRHLVFYLSSDEDFFSR